MKCRWAEFFASFTKARFFPSFRFLSEFIFVRIFRNNYRHFGSKLDALSAQFISGSEEFLGAEYSDWNLDHVFGDCSEVLSLLLLYLVLLLSCISRF